MQDNRFFFSSLFCGLQSSLFINNNGNIIACGKNDKCKLGFSIEENGYTIYPPKEIPNLSHIKTVCCGFFHSICCDFDGNIFTFGDNKEGQLGINNTNILYTHTPQKVNLPPIYYISCGINFNVCLAENEKIYVFGSNSKGELGLGDYNDRFKPEIIHDIHNISIISCSSSSVICKTSSGDLYAWGYNNCGQLGINSNKYCINIPTKCINWPENIISIKCGNFHCLLLTITGQVYSFGNNSKFRGGYGALGFPKDIEMIIYPKLIENLPEIQRIECTSHASFCIDIDDNLWVFGQNNRGQLGIEGEEHRFKPIKHKVLGKIRDISSGGTHSFVKRIDNKIYAFGWNENKQLGFEGKTYKQFKPKQVFKKTESEIWRDLSSRVKSARK